MGSSNKGGRKPVGGKFGPVGGNPAFDPYAIPTTDTDSLAFNARDIARRMAQRANGLDSTIRTSAAGALYNAQPKQLLGT